MVGGFVILTESRVLGRWLDCMIATDEANVCCLPLAEGVGGGECQLWGKDLGLHWMLSRAR